MIDFPAMILKAMILATTGIEIVSNFLPKHRRPPAKTVEKMQAESKRKTDGNWGVLFVLQKE